MDILKVRAALKNGSLSRYLYICFLEFVIPICHAWPRPPSRSQCAAAVAYKTFLQPVWWKLWLTHNIVFPNCYGDFICQSVCQHKHQDMQLPQTPLLLNEFKFNMFTQTFLMIKAFIFLHVVLCVIMTDTRSKFVDMRHSKHTLTGFIRVALRRCIKCCSGFKTQHISFSECVNYVFKSFLNSCNKFVENKLLSQLGNTPFTLTPRGNLEPPVDCNAM